MNKAAMIAKIAEKSALNKKQAEAALNAFEETIIEALKEGEKVQLMGFGTFEIKERAARTGRKPSTGETIEIPAKKSPVFKAGKGFKDQF
ncbi:MAG: HU family DNA-binding protein [Clostridia bacterium]|nr:HU family DNA-binding protein [Clostridia bacterium]